MICRPINGHTPRKLPATQDGNLSLHRTSSLTIIHYNCIFFKHFLTFSSPLYYKKFNPISGIDFVNMHNLAKRSYLARISILFSPRFCRNFPRLPPFVQTLFTFWLYNIYNNVCFGKDTLFHESKAASHQHFHPHRVARRPCFGNRHRRFDHPARTRTSLFLHPRAGLFCHTAGFFIIVYNAHPSLRRRRSARLLEIPGAPSQVEREKDARA